MHTLFKVGAVFAVAAAAFWQLFLNQFLYDQLGVGREIQPVTDFGYTCKRIRHEALSSCEDLWLDSEKRQLYGICGGLNNRIAYNTFEGSFNKTLFKRRLGTVVVLNIDEPGKDGLYGVRALKKPGFKGPLGDDTLCPNGFDVEIVDDKTRRFYLTDNSPPVNSKFELQDISDPPHIQTSIHVFEHKVGSNSMQFQYKLSSDAIISPNRVIHIGDGGLMLTNDNNVKYGLRRTLGLLLGGGSVTYCDTKTMKCSIVADKGFAFPNGLGLGPDRLLYVPNTGSMHVGVFEIRPDRSLTKRGSFYLPMPLDNFAMDTNGDLWIAGFPSFIRSMSIEDPYSEDPPSTIWRIRRADNGTWQTDKIVEDVTGDFVGGVTAVVHDTKTGRLFLGGVLSDHITVCEPRAI